MGPGTPKPECCGEPMLWHKDARRPSKGYWHCRVERQAAQRQQYEAMNGVAYNWLLLRGRRNKVMERRRNREAV